MVLADQIRFEQFDFCSFLQISGRPASPRESACPHLAPGKEPFDMRRDAC
jgi:hypothetical protein